jgi:phage baseplate assembly protein W
MIDFQTIFIRDVADLQQINFIAVLRIDAGDSAGVRAVYINGQTAKYIKALDGRTLYAHLPDGVSQKSVHSIRLLNVLTTENSSEESIMTIYESEGALDPETKLTDALHTGTFGPVSFYGGVLQLRGEDLSSTQRVKINNSDVPFTIVSKTEVMCSLPKNASTIDRVDVITSSKTINRRTYFEYMVDENPMSVTGTQKLIQQFIKLLLTTKGSDVFAPTLGGDLQQFVGTNFSPSNTSAIVAQVTLRVVETGIAMSLRQTAAGVSPNERLSDVQVLGVSVDPDDPTIMSLSLRLNTFGGRSVQFSTMLGEATDFAASTQSAVSSALGGSSGSTGY